MIGAIAGDIIGSRFEFNNYRATDFELFSRECTYTDDTVMTMAVADAILNGKPFGATMREYGHANINRGYGGRFFQWLFSNDPKPYDSFGNGSAMRVSPCAFLANGDREKALTWAVNSAVCTHNHPEGIKGAMAVTDAILLAYSKKQKSEIKDYISRIYGYDLNFTIEKLRPHYPFDETCQGSVPQAIVAFLESDSFEGAIRLAVSLGGDSDTIACITGGMAEAYYGVPEEIVKKTKSLLPDNYVKVIEGMYEGR
ncbi:MAG: ADP-ribosylglycohydrolase family protein [Bacteroidales bacterium]|nr:ADP-ribosylglycohydrolase family protein [Bacteroidales bacterium]